MEKTNEQIKKEVRLVVKKTKQDFMRGKITKEEFYNVANAALGIELELYLRRKPLPPI